jgi:hypothetical protein
MHPTNPLPHLPAGIARHIVETLFSVLPHPASSPPQERAIREQGAINALVALRPMDAFEAHLALQVVAAEAHAGECLRLASQPGQSTQMILRCRATAASLMRQVLEGERLLKRQQAIAAKKSPAAASSQKATHASAPVETKPRVLH